MVKEGHEYFHEGSDLETGLFNLQRNFRDVIITSSILDLLSTDLGGVSLPNMTGFKQLQLFSDIHTTICFKNSKGSELAVKKILEILPKSDVYLHLHHPSVKVHHRVNRSRDCSCHW